MKNSIFFDERSRFTIFEEVESKDLDLGQCLSICWFCLFYCTVFCDPCAIGGQCVVLPQLFFSRKRIILIHINQDMRQKPSYEGRDWTLRETRFPVRFSNTDFQRQSWSKKSPLFHFDCASTNTFGKQMHQVGVEWSARMLRKDCTYFFRTLKTVNQLINQSFAHSLLRIFDYICRLTSSSQMPMILHQFPQRINTKETLNSFEANCWPTPKKQVPNTPA